MKKHTKIMICLSILFSFTGCIQNQQTNNTIDNKGSLTFGDIQRDIKIGTSKSQVASSIGSPNIISNEGNKEIWIYDKISKEISENNTSGNIGGAGIIGSGIAFGTLSGESKNTTTISKTMTVIFTFDSNNKVEKIDYHTSKY